MVNTQEDQNEENNEQDTKQKQSAEQQESAEQTESIEQELKEDLLRLQAEFDNFQKRMQREQEVFRKHATEGLIRELLPVMDNFAITISNNKEENEFSKGVELTFAQLAEILQGQGLEKIEAEGKKFNPQEHEALMTKESDKEPNTVIEVMQDGYTINNKIIRHAKVIISKKEE